MNIVTVNRIIFEPILITTNLTVSPVSGSGDTRGHRPFLASTDGHTKGDGMNESMSDYTS